METETRADLTALRDSLESTAADKGYLQAVLHQAVDAIIAIGLDGTVRSFNRAAEQIFGYRAADVIGRNVSVLMPEPHHSAHDGYLRHFHATGEGKVIGQGQRELPARRADGTIFPIELGVSEVELPGGHFFIGLIRDISQRKRAEAGVLAAGHHAQMVIDSVPIGILGMNRSGTITLANDTATKLFGYEREELMGQPVEILLPQALRGAHPALRSAFFSNPQARAMGTGRDLFATRKDGSEFPVEIGLNPIESDSETWVLCSIVDITERKRAEGKNTLLAAIVDSSDDAIISKTLGSIITSWNAGAERMFGYCASEAIGCHIGIIIPPGQADETYILNRLRKGEHVEHFETLRQHKSGRTVAVSLNVSPLLDAGGRIVGASSIVRDITARKQVENERSNLIANLKQSNQELDDFAYIASHDLREPLRGLSNNAQFLKEDYAAQVDEVGIKRLDRICFLCNRMVLLIDNLLYLSRLGRQELAYSNTDLNTVVHDILEQSESASGEPGVSVKINEKLPALVCDATRIGEVFRNLIANAIKYNNKPEKLVEIGYLSEYGRQHNVIYVRDNGIGIPAEFQNEVFTIFKRLHPEDDAVRGSGVGLTFAKKIVERHGGHIWLESQQGQGTTFFFTIQERQKT